jgi:hypothetical protein
LAEESVEQSSLLVPAGQNVEGTAGTARTGILEPVGEVSERLDPYVRRKKEVWEKHDELRRVIVQERGVEKVIRRGTWENVVRRCQLHDKVQDWELEMERWRKLQK